MKLFTRERPELSLKEISDLTNIHKSTVFRILSTLHENKYLVRDPLTKRYKPGIRVLQLGFAALSSLDLRQVAKPYLLALSKKTGYTVSLAVLDERGILYIDRIRTLHVVGVLLGIGSNLPVNCTSMGKVLLAFLPDGKYSQYLQDESLSPCTPKSISNRKNFLTELSVVREKGYALNDEELEIGLRAVAAPIRDNTNEVIAAMNMSGPSRLISIDDLEKQYAPLIVSTAAQVSLALGYNQ